MPVKIKESDSGLASCQGQAALLLASGKTGVETAKMLNKAPETISRWNQQPEFKALVRRFRLEILETTKALLTSSTCTAVQALAGIAADPKATPQDRIKAAQTLLEHCPLTGDAAYML